MHAKAHQDSYVQAFLSYICIKDTILSVALAWKEVNYVNLRRYKKLWTSDTLADGSSEANLEAINTRSIQTAK
jgi:hypothetical protein